MKVPGEKSKGKEETGNETEAVSDICGRGSESNISIGCCIISDLFLFEL
jgi:hypothetical protein